MTSALHETAADSFDALLQRIARLSHVPLEGRLLGSPLAEGSVLSDGRFVIQRLLGQGGMGTVYEALDTSRGARVALKSIGAIDAPRVHRFKQEFRALADVVHPNLVRLHELFASDQTWFFTMELVEGCSFLDHVRPLAANAVARVVLGAPLPAGLGAASDPLDVTALQRALVQLVRGVQAIHRAGKLHCDLKPSNVLVTPRGQVVVLDYGLVSDRSTSAQEHGTPAYMPPEAHREPASDWYAVGVMLFEALTGRLPFDGEPRAIMARKRALPAPEPVANHAGVPSALIALCRALLEREPSDRPQAEAILHALGASATRVAHAPALALGPERVFVGRKHELAALHDALAEAERGRLVACRVHGASGIGKSALVHHAFDELERDGRGTLLHGRCHEHEAIPYKLLDGVVDGLGCRLAQLEAEHAIDPDALAALVRAFPALGRFARVRERGQHAGLPLEHDALRELVARGIQQGLRALRVAGPLVIHIDDAQWGDADGARLLGEVLAPFAPGLLLCVSYRSDQPCTGLDALWQALSAEGAELRDVSVRELPAEEQRELIALLARGSSLDIDQLTREGAGIPLFASELVQRALQGGGAGSLDDAILARTRELPADARHLLAMTIVSGVPAERSVLAHATGIAQLDRALAYLRVQRLVRTRSVGHETWVEPFHDRIREAIERTAMAGDVHAAHQRLARALEALRPDEVERLALHLEGCGEQEAAAHYAIRAAKRAEHALAFDRAADWYARAIALGRFTEVQAHGLHFEHAAALAAADRGAEAAEALLRAARGESCEEASLLEVQAAEHRLAAGDVALGVELLVQRGLGALGLLPTEPARVLETIQALNAELQTKLEQRLAESQHTPEVSPEPAPESLLRRVDALCSASLDLYQIGEPLLSGAASSQHLRLALESKDPLRIARAAYLQASRDATLAITGSTASVDVLMQVAANAAQRTRDPQLEVWRHAALVARASHLAQPDRIRQAWWAASDAARHCAGGARVIASLRVTAFGALAELARYDEMRACSAAWTRAARARHKGHTAWVAALCDTRSLLDDTGGELYLERGEDVMASASHIPRMVGDLCLHQVELYLGRTSDALTRVRRAEASATKMIIPMHVRHIAAAIHRAVLLCELARAAEGHSDARQAAQAALDALDALGLRSSCGASLAGRAQLAFIGGDHGTAIELLQRVIEESTLEDGNPARGLCAQRARGTLLGGAEGARLIERADTGLRRLTVRNPARWQRMMLPGFVRA